MNSWELSYMKENIFKNSIKFDLPKTDIKPILKNATDKDIGTKPPLPEAILPAWSPTCATICSATYLQTT